MTHSILPTEIPAQYRLPSVQGSVWAHFDSSSWTRGFNKHPVHTAALHWAVEKKKKRLLITKWTGMESTLGLEYWLNSLNPGVWDKGSVQNTRWCSIHMHTNFSNYVFTSCEGHHVQAMVIRRWAATNNNSNWVTCWLFSQFINSFIQGDFSTFSASDFCSTVDLNLILSFIPYFEFGDNTSYLLISP